ncbi:alpha/beta hydrolase [uncultured Cohaesibacter sp.]|uniref:alpha/beta fold hydrolase n=1 Tax=uncultured Cohaesibacter sp. TaxID=1002546 RepID=UPI00292E8BDC|nr:alpha/beta hydrolase [uncultured Cohaesibacter sp.]
MPFLDLDRIALRYADEGDGEKTLLLIHEMGGSLESWDYLVPLLTPHYRVIRYDCRGAGLSEKPRSPFTIFDFTADAIGLLDALGIEGPVIPVGCAVGAATALHMAAIHPDRFERIVSISPSTGISEERQQAVLARADLLENDGSRAGVDVGLDRGYPSAYRKDRNRFTSTRAQRIGADPYGFAATMRMLAGLSLDEDIAKVSCPCLFIAGEIDADRPPAAVEAIASTVSNSTFRVIEGGHFMAMHSPDLLAAEIFDFLRQ